MKIFKYVISKIVEYPFIAAGIILILDISLRDFLLHRYTYQVDSEAILETHMDFCRDVFIIITFGVILKWRKFIANKLLIRPLIPVYICIIIEVLCKYYIVYHFKLSFHPLTILSLTIGILESSILLIGMYLLVLLSPPSIRRGTFQLLFIAFLFITILDCIYFKYAETHVQKVVFDNLSVASVKGAISGIHQGYYFLILMIAVLLIALNSWSIKGIVSIYKFRIFICCLFPILCLALILVFAINTKCIALDRDLGENYGTIYIRLEKTRQKYRSLLSVSPVINFIQERRAEIKASDILLTQKQFISYNKIEQYTLNNLGLIKKPTKKLTYNNTNYRTIVMIVFESLHSDFIHFTNPFILADATPFFDKILRDYPHIDNYFTSSIPTSLGLNATFNSQIQYNPEFSLRHHQDTLFSLLAKKGLDGYFISGVSGDHQDERNLYPKLFRIKNYIAKEELDKRYHGASGWGYHDDVVLQEGLRILKERNGQPTFIVLKLIDLHQPGEYSGIPNSKLPASIRNSNNSVIASLYWENKCLENFFNAAKNDGLFNSETLFVITADHGPYLGSQTLSRPENRRALSKIPLIFISPNISLFAGLNPERFASQIDLAPTLLSVMGIEQPSYFLGDSVLSELPGFAFGMLDGMLQYDRNGLSFTVPIIAGTVEHDVRASALNKFLNNIQTDSFIYGGARTGM